MKRTSLLVLFLLILTAGPSVLGQTWEQNRQPSAALGWNPQRTWVYFVGLLEWRDKTRFGSFPQKNRRDAILLDVLREKGVPESQIFYLQDSQATTARVNETFPKFLQRARAGDTVIVYFCGHGYKTDGNKTTFLATYDVSDKTEGWRTDAIPAAIEQNFKGATAVLLADNCYSGALAEDVQALANPRVSYAVMTSTHFNSFSTANWTFTESLIYGFRGDSFMDDNRDSKVTFAELQANAEADMLFAEEQVASFLWTGDFDPQGVAAWSSPTNAARIGERVEAYSVDGWYKGFIRDAQNGKFQIRYYGYEETDDEWVMPQMVRTIKPKQFPVGTRVNVNWLGKWYTGKVLAVKGGSHYITFDGFGKEWDEWTPASRIRRLNK